MVESKLSLEQFDDVPAGERSHDGCGSCGSGDAGGKCGNGLEKVYPTTAVRFGFMRYVGEFSHVPDMKFTCGAKVVIQTRRGIEIGDQVSLSCSGCDKSVTRDQMRSWVDTSGEDTYMFDAGRILREATAADLAEHAHMQQSGRVKRDFARKLAIEHKLGLKVVDCECLFGGERIVYYFTAADRIDFRAMVKDLAQEYRTRIEMRQIGARDEARLLADFETCGQEVCCKVFLKTLKPISMRMAKVQKATLDPTQVSGRCGRLKCCLRYEHVGYEELDKKLPRNGIRIRTKHGDGVVINRQILTQLVQIRMDDDTIVTVVEEDILVVGIKPGEKPEPAAEAPRVGSNQRQKAGGKSRQRSRPRGGRGGEQRREGGTEPAPAPDASPEASQEVKPEAATDEDKQDRPRRRRRRRRKRGGGEGGSESSSGSGPSGD